jgi:hypothetical protein
MSDKPQKKPRSEAQIAAFEKAKAVRESNMRKKFEEEQKQQHEEQQQPEQHESESVDTEVEASVVFQQPIVAAAPLVATAPVVAQQQEDDIFELDVDDLYSKLQQNQKDIADLREHFGSLRQNHDDISTQWQQYTGHGADINFV